MRESQPDGSSLTCKGIFKKLCYRRAKTRGYIGPIDGRHQTGNQYRTGVDDVASRVLIISIVGTRVDIVAVELRVDVVARKLTTSDYMNNK